MLICYNHKMQILLPKHGDVPSDASQPAGDVDSPSLPAGTHLFPNERGGDSGGGGVRDGVDDDDCRCNVDDSKSDIGDDDVGDKYDIGSDVDD